MRTRGIICLGLAAALLIGAGGTVGVVPFGTDFDIAGNGTVSIGAFTGDVVKPSGSLATTLNTVAVAKGGTGATAAQAAAANLAVPYILCKPVGGPVSAGAVTTEEVLATCTVPANSLGLNGALRIRTNSTASGAGGSRTVRIRYSGAAGTVIYGTAAGAAVTDVQLNVFIRNVGATNSQVGAGSHVVTSGSAITTPKVTMAVDTTASSSVVISCQKASAGDVCTLDQYLVELIADGA